jgi:hypothetical protein
VHDDTVKVLTVRILRHLGCLTSCTNGKYDMAGCDRHFLAFADDIHSPSLGFVVPHSRLSRGRQPHVDIILIDESLVSAGEIFRAEEVGIFWLEGPSEGQVAVLFACVELHRFISQGPILANMSVAL